MLVLSRHSWRSKVSGHSCASYRSPESCQPKRDAPCSKVFEAGTAGLRDRRTINGEVRHRIVSESDEEFQKSDIDGLPVRYAGWPSRYEGGRQAPRHVSVR